MFKPRGNPKLYRQGNIWHVRVYVPKPVIPIVGKSEKHKSMDTEDYAIALERAEDWRREQFSWFNEIFHQAVTAPQVVEELSDEFIGALAREVYLDYRAEVDQDLLDFLASSPDEHAAHEIPEQDRNAVLRDLLATFDPIGAAKDHASDQLKSRGLSISPDSISYKKLTRHIREAFIQVHVDIVNNYASTPGKDDNPFFVDQTTKEPVPPTVGKSARSSAVYRLREQAKQLQKEVSNSRGAKGVAKIENTMTLMMDWFGEDHDIRGISRAEVVTFRDALMKVPTNMSKRYPGRSMSEAIKSRLPEHSTLSISSVNTHLRNMVQLFNNAQRYDDSFHPPNLTQIKIPDPVDDLDKRFPFPTDKLEVLFASIADQNTPVTENEFFWSSVIGLYHGLRASEIGELIPDDITMMFDTPCIRIRLPKAIADRSRKGRSKTLPRLLPMHPILIALGLPELALKSVDQEYLFRSLREDKDGYRGDKLTDWALRVVASQSCSGQKLSFHSFRHNFLDALDDAEISEKWKAYLGGWKLPGVMNKTYGSKEMKENIIPAISKISYGEVDSFLLSKVAQGCD